jgi:hypothetical protein
VGQGHQKSEIGIAKFKRHPLLEIALLTFPLFGENCIAAVFDTRGLL